MNLKNVLVFATVLLGIYFIFLKKKPVHYSKKNTAEQVQENKKSEESKEKTSPVVFPKVDTKLSGRQIYKNSPDLEKASVQAEYSIDVESDKWKQAQIIPEYGDYAPTPSVLTGQSAKIFSLFVPEESINDIEIKDIASAFLQGLYPTKNMIKILGLNDSFDGTIYIGYELKYHVTWELHINAESISVKGVFSLQMNGVEKSCPVLSFEPLKNFTFLSNEDNGTILVMSCDKSFYMQLYRHSANTISGIYFEKSGTDQTYKNTGSVSLYRRGNDF